MEHTPETVVDAYIADFPSKRTLACLACQLFRDLPAGEPPRTVYVYPIKQCLNETGGTPYIRMRHLSQVGLMVALGANRQSTKAPSKQEFSLADTPEGVAFGNRLQELMPPACKIEQEPDLPAGIRRALGHSSPTQLLNIIEVAMRRLDFLNNHVQPPQQLAQQPFSTEQTAQAQENTSPDKPDSC